MKRVSSLTLTLALGLLAGACGSDPSQGPITAATDGGVRPGDGGQTSGNLTGPCTTGATNACTCPPVDGGGGTSGVQHCYDNNWLLCNCYAPTTPVVPVVLAGDCKPGRYEGTFTGLYTSPYTGIGFPIPVVALNPVGPGLAFTLNADYVGGGSEFSQLTISDGFVKGAADGAFPFDGVLKGTLDCPTKTFTGTLTGRYCVGPCLGINEGKFDGPITGNYDGTSFSFTNGTWDLVELKGQMGLFGMFGGNGDWNAKWVGEGTVDLDSGVTSSTGGDAGP